MMWRILHNHNLWLILTIVTIVILLLYLICQYSVLTCPISCTMIYRDEINQIKVSKHCLTVWSFCSDVLNIISLYYQVRTVVLWWPNSVFIWAFGEFWNACISVDQFFTLHPQHCRLEEMYFKFFSHIRHIIIGYRAYVLMCDI
jgi:hypothetical protein